MEAECAKDDDILKTLRWPTPKHKKIRNILKKRKLHATMTKQ